jgi:hypothetical protein
MVKNVESFGPELQLEVFEYRKFATNCEIPLLSAKASCKIAGSITNAGIDAGKSQWVDRSPTGTSLAGLQVAQTLEHGGAIRPIQIHRLPLDKSTVVLLPSCRVGQRLAIQRHRKWGTRNSPLDPTRPAPERNQRFSGSLRFRRCLRLRICSKARENSTETRRGGTQTEPSQECQHVV